MSYVQIFAFNFFFWLLGYCMGILTIRHWSRKIIDDTIKAVFNEPMVAESTYKVVGLAEGVSKFVPQSRTITTTATLKGSDDAPGV